MPLSNLISTGWQVMNAINMPDKAISTYAIIIFLAVEA